MKIDKDGNDIQLVFSLEDINELKLFLDNHLLLPKLQANAEDYARNGWEFFGKLLRALDLIIENKSGD